MLFNDEVHTSAAKSSTFSDNGKLPIHRWFKYSAGFSALWVAETIRQEIASSKKPVHVLDPFAGSGTVLVEANKIGIASYGIESHPFVARIARVKSRTDIDHDQFHEYADRLIKSASTVKPNINQYPELIRSCYPDDALNKLDQLRKAWQKELDDPCSEFGWLAIASILRQCSPVGTANWQYILPKKTKAKIIDPFLAFKAKSKQMEDDLCIRNMTKHTACLLQGELLHLDYVHLQKKNNPIP